MTTLPRQPEAIIFDMDGTIFDTERMYQRALATAVTEAGGEISGADLLLTVGLSWDDCRTLLAERFSNIVPVDDLVADWLTQYGRLADHGLPLKAGFLELLDDLDRMHLPRAIATSAYRDDVVHNLAAHGLTDRFHAIVAAGECEKPKPAPDTFFMAAQALGVRPRLCLAIEDSSHGVQSAFAAGMMTVMVPDTVPAGEQEVARCVMIAKDLHQVRSMLKGE